MKYFLESLMFLKAYFSPFKAPKIKFYFGKIRMGVPYFHPRKTVKSKTKPGYYEFKYIKWFGFNYTGLGYKTKWEPDDYRHEWNPIFSFVFIGLQFCILIVPDHDMHYWESWLYYNYNTDKTKSKKDRIIQCMEKFPNIWVSTNKDGSKEEINYYKLILRKKYLKYIPT